MSADALIRLVASDIHSCHGAVVRAIHTVIVLYVLNLEEIECLFTKLQDVVLKLDLVLLDEHVSRLETRGIKVDKERVVDEGFSWVLIVLSIKHAVRIGKA